MKRESAYLRQVPHAEIPGVDVTPSRKGSAVVSGRLLLAALTVLGFASACATDRIRQFQWEEEFVLDTGESLLLQRVERYRYGTATIPWRTGWIPEESKIVVLRGPADLLGARYTLKEWIAPVVLERDPSSRTLVLIGTSWNCYWILPMTDKSRWAYRAFRLTPQAEAEEIVVPLWAWDKQRRLYLINVEIKPPMRVTQAEAAQHNSTKARAPKVYFSVDLDEKSLGSCGELNNKR